MGDSRVLTFDMSTYIKTPGRTQKENTKVRTEDTGHWRDSELLFTLFDMMLTPPLAAVLSSLVLWYQ